MSWNFYQNDLFYENIRSQLSAYADDHQIYISGEKIDNVVSSLEEDGNTTGRWYKSNYLSGNPFHYLSYFLCEGGKGVKKAIKKMASGLVRDAEKTWFAELSDKGNTALCRLPDDSLVP